MRDIIEEDASKHRTLHRKLMNQIQTQVPIYNKIHERFHDKFFQSGTSTRFVISFNLNTSRDLIRKNGLVKRAEIILLGRAMLKAKN
jgi:hypothetical protein